MRDAHPDVSAWLHLAATPAFAAMALWTAVANDPMDMLCSHGMWSLNGMTPMYVLMAAFHAGPWLRRIEARRGRPSREQGDRAGVRG